MTEPIWDIQPQSTPLIVVTTMILHKRLLPYLFLLPMLMACSDARPRGGDDGEPVSPIRSMVLIETEELYLGDPYRFTVHSDGSFFVTDRFTDRIYRFAADGTPMRTYGGPGAGPGEFRGITQVFLVSDDIVAGYDGQERRFKLFHIDSGDYLGLVETKGIASSIRLDGDTLWMGSTSPELATGIEVRPIERDSARYLGPLPAEYQDAPMYFGFNADAFVVLQADRVLLGYAGRNDLLLLSRDGAVLDTVEAPVRRRRGVPWDIAERMLNARTLREQASQHSQLQNLHVLADGSVVMVYEDLEIEGEPPAVRTTSELFFTVLDPSLDATCVDVALPSSADARPRTAFRGDTLFVLDRPIVDAAVQTVVHVFVVPEIERCFPQTQSTRE